VISAYRSVFIGVLLLSACTKGDTPVKYEICDRAGGSCSVHARFQDFDVKISERLVTLPIVIYDLKIGSVTNVIKLRVFIVQD